MANSERRTLFPSVDQTISNITATFSAEDGQYLLLAKGLQSGDELLIEFEMGNSSECDPVWVPLVDCCGQVKLVYPKSFLLLPLPLRYRAVLTDTANAYQTDPTHFADVMIQGFRTGGQPSFAGMAHSCCTATTSASGCCDTCSTANINFEGIIGG